MKTVSVNVMTLCVPCENRCRYCLLSYDGKTVGINYDRCKKYALNFYKWINKNRKDLSFLFGFGYSMDHPKLLDEIKFLQDIGCASGEFLQFDGMKFRKTEDLKQFLEDLKNNGIKLIDLTFYGTKEYHDKFAARKGDFDYMVEVAKIAGDIGLGCQIGIALTSENAEQIDELVDFFSKFPTEKMFLFVPHGEGRGVSLEGVRFDKTSLLKLGEKALSKLNLNKFKTEKEWLEREYVEPTKRVITISLTPENVDMFEKMSFNEAIKYVEKLDDEYYKTLPSYTELAKIYGDKNGEKFYSQRDLYLKYQRLYIADNKINVYDVNDERYCFSRRF